MKFDNQYLNYETYRLLGGKMDYMPFNLLEFEARKIIDGRTQKRLKGVEEIPQEVKLCINKMINTIGSYISATNVDTSDSINKNNISSESVGSYSVSYITPEQILSNVQEIIKSKNKELEDIMFNYLINCVVNNEHIMYNGVS